MIGFITENGPCNFMDDADMFPSKNEHAWTDKTNMVWLESPSGVGYNNNDNKFKYDDETVADENLLSVQAFFHGFEELRGRDLYLSGESYAGIYVPYLAKRILDFNNDPSTATEDKINLKGFIIGNAVTDWKYDTQPALMEFAYMHSLMDKDTKEKIDAHPECHFRTVGGGIMKPVCYSLMADVQANLKNLNAYDIYRHPEQFYYKKTMHDLLNGKMVSDIEEEYEQVPLEGQGQINPMWTQQKGLGIGITQVIDYMNNDQVKSALHIPSDFKWGYCSRIKYSKLAKGTIWIYPELQGEIKMAHYAGDTDGVVPHIGTINWMDALGWPITKPYHEWNIGKYQNGGWAESREGLDLIIIHGGGHMIPEWKRPESKHAIQTWLSGEDL